jgi:hypothetical protein
MRMFARTSEQRRTGANPGSHGRVGRRVVTVASVFALGLIAPLHFALAEERCGWLENPTPGNWWLRDAHGLWIISAQGDLDTAGVEKLPEAAPDHFVATNGHYGYSCACVSGTFDDHSERMRVDAARILPLSVCRGDKGLPAAGGSP